MSIIALSLVILGQTSPRAWPRIGIRAFKSEHQMEIWGATNDRGPFQLIATYTIAAISGGLGPKRQEGDAQAPEGFYYINRFNPKSQFHLSLGLNYPNSSDKKLGVAQHLVKDIFIHGNHVSAGCLAMTDPIIDIIYGLALLARDAGQKAIPVSIFPCRMNSENWKSLKTQYASRPDLLSFWSTVRPGYDSFDHSHYWPRPHVSQNGAYYWPERS